MMLRVVIVAVLVAVVLAMIGRWTRRVPRAPGRRAVEPARKCPRCGSYVVAGAPCPCGE
jgi:hypothetical protein